MTDFETHVLSCFVEKGAGVITCRLFIGYETHCLLADGISETEREWLLNKTHIQVIVNSNTSGVWRCFRKS